MNAFYKIPQDGKTKQFSLLPPFSGQDIGELDLSSNNLRVIPTDIRRLTSLVVLDLSKNGLRCTNPHDFTGLPMELAQLPALEVILIAECNLAFIPPAVWKCPHLKILDISRNKINILPPELGNLEKLEHLNAQQTNVNTLPAEIAFCQELQELFLWGNTIESLPETMKELPKLKTLALNYRSFCTIIDTYMENLLKKGQIQSEHIPPVIFEMPGLEILDLDSTKINWVPEQCASGLRELILSKNYFQKMPSMILSMETLEVLDVCDNMISALPDQIGKLVNLQVLRANDNSIGYLPMGLCKMARLQELCVGGNNLKSLPQDIGQLSSLRSLLLDKNQIKALPDSIIDLEELETLDLTGNEITTLPVNFYQMKKLKTAHTYCKFRKHGLWLHQNPLTSPPREIWQTDDPDKIYKYLKKLKIMKTENLQRQKLIVLGESQCGKTSLIQTMSTGKSALTRQDSNTPLINFLAWITDNEVSFLINDVGGDEAYSITYPMFLDPKALYVLVYDHRKYTPSNHHTALGYWLDLLYMYTPGAVVKVVGTQCDHCYPDFVEKIREQVKENLDQQVARNGEKVAEELKRVDQMIKDEKHAHMRPHLQHTKTQLLSMQRNPLRIMPNISLVSSAEGMQGVLDLITDLEILTVNKELFPHAQRYIPEPWVKFKAALKARKDYCLPFEDITKIASKFHIPKEAIPECLAHFSSIGEILWFRNFPQLEDVIFQRPVLLVEVLRGLFKHDMKKFLDYDNNRIFASRGQFSAETFHTALEQFQKYGQISRPLLQCFWFYLKLDYDGFNSLKELLPNLDLCYVIPQADFPPPRTEYEPLMVVPHFNNDKNPADISENCEGLWPRKTPSDLKELQMTLTFPIIYPSGLIERLACRIQDKVLERHDWQDLIHAKLNSGSMLLSRELNPQTFDCIIKVKVRGVSMATMQEDLASLWDSIQSLLSSCPGLVYYTSFKVVNCSETFPMDSCLPPKQAVPVC